MAKLVGDQSYSIITDQIGAPIEVLDQSGASVWSSSRISGYGVLRDLEGGRDFCPFRFQGQYVDIETGLYYNRFRYFDPEAGQYISQDPIGLAGGNPTLYAYVSDQNTFIDIFGLNCSSDAAKLRKNMASSFIAEPQYKNAAHHIVMSNSMDPRMIILRKKMKKLGIDKNDAVNGVYLPISNRIKKKAKTSALAHSSIHTNKYKSNVYKRLINKNTKEDFKASLHNIARELTNGTFSK